MRDIHFEIRREELPHIMQNRFHLIITVHGSRIHMDITELCNYLDRNSHTSIEAEVNERRKIALFENAYNEYLRKICKIDTVDQKDFFRSMLLEALNRMYYSLKFSNKKEIVKPQVPEPPKVPEDIKEALDITELAMKRQKQIKEFEIEIKEKKNSFYKKHGTFTEKCLAYIGR